MTYYEMFKNKTIDELADWFNEHMGIDDTPWVRYFDKTYCKKCDGVEHEGHDYAWCELNDKCKFFQEMDDIPDNKQIIKMWLELEVKNENEFADNIDEVFSSYFGL